MQLFYTPMYEPNYSVGVIIVINKLNDLKKANVLLRNNAILALIKLYYMLYKTNNVSNNYDFKKLIELLIKTSVLALLLVWCFLIIKPFVLIVVWGLILAVALFPAFSAIKQKVKNNKLSAIILVLILIGILFVPTYFLADSLFAGIKNLSVNIDSSQINIVEPPIEIKSWPIIGDKLFELWQATSQSLEETAIKYQAQLIQVGNSILKALLTTGAGFLQFILSIIIAGALLANTQKGAESTKNVFQKLVGDRGEEFMQTTVVTIRNIAKGVIGISLLQSLLLGVVFLLAGIPYAGLWALLCLILGIIQVGPGLISIGAIVFLFVTHSPLVAILWTVIIIAFTLLDNILKPIVFGKGAPAPMLVIFIGAIGGFIAFGFIGLFLGAIVLSLGYKLYNTWLLN